MTGSYYRMSFAIEPRIDPNTKSATITLVHYGAWKDIWAVVDIRETATGTQVNAYTTNHPLMSDFGIIAEKWANGSQECQTYPITTHQFPNVE
jgi:hypothetical protein